MVNKVHHWKGLPFHSNTDLKWFLKKQIETSPKNLSDTTINQYLKSPIFGKGVGIERVIPFDTIGVAATPLAKLDPLPTLGAHNSAENVFPRLKSIGLTTKLNSKKKKYFFSLASPPNAPLGEINENLFKWQLTVYVSSNPVSSRCVVLKILASCLPKKMPYIRKIISLPLKTSHLK